MTAWLVGGAIVLAIGIVIVLANWLLERRERREEQASLLQTRIAEQLRRDPVLARIRIDPVARPPIGDGPVTIELSGRLGDLELRGRALAIAETEARRLNVAYRIDDRLDPAA